MTLTFWGHVTSSVTWPFDSRLATSYGWSIVTMRLSRTVMEIWHIKSWTDTRTLRWFYTPSNAMHCIRQTTRNKQNTAKIIKISFKSRFKYYRSF